MYYIALEMSKFSENLKKIMGQYNITQVILAEKSGLGQSHISQLCRGVKNPTLPVLLSLAKALNCSLEELTGMEELKKIDESPEIKKEALEFSELFEKLEEKSKKAITTLMKSLKKEEDKEDKQE